MKITCISDTHGLHSSIEAMRGDMIIHAGDLSGRGRPHEIADFIDWFQSLDFEFKIFIAGNHDFYLEHITDQELDKLIPPNVIYLNDSGVEVENLKIWGSPIQPNFHNWAFNRERGAVIKKHWDLIPNDTDILITHGPPMNVLDQTRFGEHVGCEELLKKVNAVKPKQHIFGHIHEAYGVEEKNGTKFINAAVLNERYIYTNPPIEVSM